MPFPGVRRAIVHRWFCEHEDLPPADPDEARVRGYDLRSAAQEALFRVHMLTDDAALGERAEAAFRGIEALHRSGDREALDRRRNETRAAIDAFVGTARAHTRTAQPLPLSPPSPSPSRSGS